MVNDYLLTTTCRRLTLQAKSLPPNHLRRRCSSATRNQTQRRRTRRWYRHMTVDQVWFCNARGGLVRQGRAGMIMRMEEATHGSNPAKFPTTWEQFVAQEERESCAWDNEM